MTIWTLDAPDANGATSYNVSTTVMYWYAGSAEPLSRVLYVPGNGERLGWQQRADHVWPGAQIEFDSAAEEGIASALPAGTWDGSVWTLDSADADGATSYTVEAVVLMVPTTGRPSARVMFTPVDGTQAGRQQRADAIWGTPGPPANVPAYQRAKCDAVQATAFANALPAGSTA